MSESDQTPAPSTGAEYRRGPFREGERIQLTDPKGRMHTITLTPGKQFHTHRGHIKHDDLIGSPDAVTVTNTAGVEYLAVRPLLSDYVMSMPRGAAVVYPKDAGQIVTMADIFPGARVVEAGVGSGALSMSLLRAVGEDGRLYSFERREDFAAIAAGNAREFFGVDHPAWSIHLGDLAEHLARPAGAHDVRGQLRRRCGRRGCGGRGACSYAERSHCRNRPDRRHSCASHLSLPSLWTRTHPDYGSEIGLSNARSAVHR